ELLEEMGLASTPRLHVWNKIDFLPESALSRLSSGLWDVAVSAQTGSGVPQLLRRIDETLNTDPIVEVDFELSSTDSKSLALLRQRGTVLSEQYIDHRILVRVRLPESLRVSLTSGRLAATASSLK
ncbi:MAG TPA: hypothetical protein VKW70_01365, partial [Terriglobia bacterium]|nr:hypothetical protein [Terriglobia bacterium]